MNPDPDYTIEMSVDDIRLLYKSVCFHLEKWPGGDAVEQEYLHHMKGCLYRMILEHKFNEL